MTQRAVEQSCTYLERYALLDDQHQNNCLCLGVERSGGNRSRSEGTDLASSHATMLNYSTGNPLQSLPHDLNLSRDYIMLLLEKYAYSGRYRPREKNPDSQLWTSAIGGREETLGLWSTRLGRFLRLYETCPPRVLAIVKMILLGARHRRHTPAFSSCIVHIVALLHCISS